MIACVGNLFCRVEGVTCSFVGNSLVEELHESGTVNKFRFGCRHGYVGLYAEGNLRLVEVLTTLGSNDEHTIGTARTIHGGG